MFRRLMLVAASIVLMAPVNTQAQESKLQSLTKVFDLKKAEYEKVKAAFDKQNAIYAPAKAKSDALDKLNTELADKVKALADEKMKVSTVGANAVFAKEVANWKGSISTLEKDIEETTKKETAQEEELKKLLGNSDLGKLESENKALTTALNAAEKVYVTANQQLESESRLVQMSAEMKLINEKMDKVLKAIEASSTKVDGVVASIDGEKGLKAQLAELQAALKKAMPVAKEYSRDPRTGVYYEVVK